MKDFSYFDDGLFTTFIPNTKEAEKAFNELTSITDGTGKIPSIQKEQFIYQLKKAGYSLKKEKWSVTKHNDDSLLDELFS